MLHILLLILKIIGIILAVILGILVLLICIVIFVPVRYELSGKCSGTLSTLKAKGKATWLCSLVRADIYYKENKLKWRLRIAWKKFLGGQEYGAVAASDERLPGDTSAQNKKTKGEEDDEEIWRNGFGEGDEKEKEDEESQKSDEEDWYQSLEDEEDSKKSEEELSEDEKIYQEILESIEEEDSGYEKRDRKGSEADEKRDWKGSEADEERNREEREADEERNSESGGWVKGFIKRIKALYRKIKCTVQNICNRIKKLLEKKNKILEFIRDEAHVGAFRKAKKETLKLFKRLRPKKFLLEAEFGFDDPSWTGRTLAAIAPFYPLFGGFVSLKPDFTKKKLTGRLYAKGRIRFCYFAVMAWNLFWSRNIRRTYKDIRNFKI